MSIVTRKLIAKELYVNRWFIGGAMVGALLSVFMATLGKTGFNIGSLAWLTTVIGLGVMLAIYGVMNERKEHSLEFVLSLPLTVSEYVRTKVLGLLLCFLLPWLVASLAAIALVLLTDVPDGLLPYLVLLCVFMLANFAVVLCGSMHARSEAMVTVSVVLTNMAVSIFMFTVGALPSLGQHMFGATPVWNETFFIILALELAIFVVAASLPLVVAARRRDFI
jgi:hypothetical protein